MGKMHLLGGLLELIVPALLGVEVRERSIFEYLPTLGTFDALAR